MLLRGDREDRPVAVGPALLGRSIVTAVRIIASVSANIVSAIRHKKKRTGRIVAIIRDTSIAKAVQDRHLTGRRHQKYRTLVGGASR